MCRAIAVGRKQWQNADTRISNEVQKYLVALFQSHTARSQTNAEFLKSDFTPSRERLLRKEKEGLSLILQSIGRLPHCYDGG
jgi:hypothetical protein